MSEVPLYTNKRTPHSNSYRRIASVHLSEICTGFNGNVALALFSGEFVLSHTPSQLFLGPEGPHEFVLQM